MEEFFSSNSLYIVLSIVLIVWVGIFLFLMNVNKRLDSLEKEAGKIDSGE